MTSFLWQFSRPLVTRAGRTRPKDRCSVSKDKVFQSWLQERGIEDVEAFVPDMAGSARGKVVPADKFGASPMKLPEAIFGQTISGRYVPNADNVEDRDMLLRPDPTTLRPVPWATDPTASVFLDCFRNDGTPVDTSPRRVLRNVLDIYAAKGWVPVVAPEVEFYLIYPHSDPNEEAEAPFGMPLHRQRKTTCAIDTKCFDQSIVRDGLDRHALRQSRNPL